MTTFCLYVYCWRGFRRDAGLHSRAQADSLEAALPQLKRDAVELATMGNYDVSCKVREGIPDCIGNPTPDMPIRKTFKVWRDGTLNTASCHQLTPLG